MRVYDIKSLKYRDKLAEKRRRVWILKILFFIGLVIAIIGIIFYLFFFSGFLEVTELSINGLDKVSQDKFTSKLDKRLHAKWLGLFEPQKNIIFFDSDSFKAEVLHAFPEIKEISVSKKPPRALDINIKEKEIAGIWCFGSTPLATSGSTQPTTGCKYFDKEGNLWGEAARSSGFIILVVNDVRKSADFLDRSLLDGIMSISAYLKDLEIPAKKFVIPDNFIGDFKAVISDGYELRFSLDSDIESQLKVLKIFLSEKKTDPSFHPQYIDLRISGRVYYK